MKIDRIKHILSVLDAIQDGSPDISTERLLEDTKYVAKCSHDELMESLAWHAENEDAEDAHSPSRNQGAGD